MRLGKDCLVYITHMKQNNIKNKIHDTNETQACHRFSGKRIKQQDISTGEENTSYFLRNNVDISVDSPV